MFLAARQKKKKDLMLALKSNKHSVIASEWQIQVSFPCFLQLQQLPTPGMQLPYVTAILSW